MSRLEELKGIYVEMMALGDKAAAVMKAAEKVEKIDTDDIPGFIIAHRTMIDGRPAMELTACGSPNQREEMFLAIAQQPEASPQFYAAALRNIGGYLGREITRGESIQSAIFGALMRGKKVPASASDDTKGDGPGDPPAHDSAAD